MERRWDWRSHRPWPWLIALSGLGVSTSPEALSFPVLAIFLFGLSRAPATVSAPLPLEGEAMAATPATSSLPGGFDTRPPGNEEGNYQANQTEDVPCAAATPTKLRRWPRLQQPIQSCRLAP